MTVSFPIESWSTQLDEFADRHDLPKRLFEPARMAKRLNKQQVTTIQRNWELIRIVGWNQRRLQHTASICRIKYSRMMTVRELKAALINLAHELGVE